MADSRENLIAWLRDAYAMERQALDMMEAHAGRIEHYPELKAKIEGHITETKSQAERLERCLQMLGADTSTLKTGLARASSMMQSLMSTTSGDEVVKNAIGEASFERFEMANYRCLIAAAEVCNEPEVKRVCEEILREEQAMAEWLDSQLPVITSRYLTQAQVHGSAEAKR